MMRKWFFFLLAACIGLAAEAQEIRTVNGEKYLVHTVEKGETLFGLSKHFAVPLDALTEANPAAAEGLSIGQVLLIPVKAQSKKELKSAPALANGELLHTVAKKETIYGIARKYGVGPEELRRWNPDLEHGLVVGMVLRIQAAASDAAPPVAVQPAAMDSGKFHWVQAGETLYSLEARFGLESGAVKEANGGLPEGLKAGTYIRIPRAVEPGSAQPADSGVVARPEPGTVLHIAFLLPFSFEGDSLGTAGAEERMGSTTEAAVEFRAGVDLALDTLKANGLNAEVHVFDTGMKPEQWNKLFKSDAIRGMDLYIGPFHRAAIESLVRVSGGTPVVCPVPQSNKVVLGNPTVSKAVSGRADRLKLMARYVAFKHARDNVILLKPDIFAEREIQGLVMRELQEALLPQSGKLRDSLLVVACGRRDVAGVVGKLDPVRLNILVVPSEDVEFITTVVGKFAAMVPKYAITVYGMDAWSSVNTLDVGALVKLNVHVPTSSYIDHASPAVNSFLAAYRERFHNEPGEYAFLGYDAARYFIGALMRFGSGFPKRYAEMRTDGIYLDFRMAHMGPENGWSNSGAMMLEYNGQGLVRAK